MAYCDSPEAIKQKLQKELGVDADIIIQILNEEKVSGGGKVNVYHVALFLTTLIGINACVGSNMSEYIKFLKDSFGESFLSLIGLIIVNEPVKHVTHAKTYDAIGKMNLLHTISTKIIEWIKLIKEKGATVENVLPKPIYLLIEMCINDDKEGGKEILKKYVPELDSHQSVDFHDVSGPAIDMVDEFTLRINRPITLKIVTQGGKSRIKKSKRKRKSFKK